MQAKLKRIKFVIAIIQQDIIVGLGVCQWQLLPSPGFDPQVLPKGRGKKKKNLRPDGVVLPQGPHAFLKKEAKGDGGVGEIHKEP